MNIPVCGYLNYILEFSQDTYYIIPIVATIIMYVMITDSEDKSSFINKVGTMLMSSVMGLIAHFVIASILYCLALSTIDDDQYKEFNKIMDTINSDPTYLTNEQNIELNNWAKCSIKNGTISFHEYINLKSNFEKYSRENEIKKLTKEIENKIK